jgi:CubicO group peptidase (beta-lactamase class C family)
MKKGMLFGRSMFLAVGAAFVYLLIGCASAPGVSTIGIGETAVAFGYLAEYIEERMAESGTVGLSVVIANKNGVLWSDGFGYADKENGIAVTPRTLFDLASVSKVFTATAVMQLVEQGKLDLDSPLTTYLPNFEDKKTITVRNLLTHHSGIQPDWLKGMLYETRAQQPDNRFVETAQLLRGVEVCWPPEYVWAYSNLGYSLLGALIDRSSEGSFYEYMRRNVLSAVGMAESTFDVRPATHEKMSKGYSGGKPVPHLIEREVPAGGLVSSAEELGRFMAAYLNPDDTRLLSPATRESMYIPQNARIPRDLDFAQGLGWMIGNQGFEKLGTAVFHNGGEWSANTALTLLPDLGYGIAVLTNSAEGEQITNAITREVIRVMHRLQTGEAPVEYVRPPDVQAAADELLAGFYFYQSLGIVEVETKRKDLWAISGGMKMKLIPNTEGRYRLQPMLLGILPITVPFLEPMEISFVAIEEEMLSGVYQHGAALPEFGIRIEKPVLSDIWYERQGTYELINADEKEFPIIAPWEFAIEEGFPTISGQLYGSFPFSMVVMPLDDEITVWAGLGRRAGDSIRFEEQGEDTLIQYEGYIYGKAGR